MLKILQAQFMKREISSSSSSSSSDEEDPNNLGDYFMFRKKKEIKLLQKQFSILDQNRKERL